MKESQFGEKNLTDLLVYLWLWVKAWFLAIYRHIEANGIAFLADLLVPYLLYRYSHDRLAFQLDEHEALLGIISLLGLHAVINIVIASRDLYDRERRAKEDALQLLEKYDTDRPRVLLEVDRNSDAEVPFRVVLVHGTAASDVQVSSISLGSHCIEFYPVGPLRLNKPEPLKPKFIKGGDNLHDGLDMFLARRIIEYRRGDATERRSFGFTIIGERIGDDFGFPLVIEYEDPITRRRYMTSHEALYTSGTLMFSLRFIASERIETAAA